MDSRAIGPKIKAISHLFMRYFKKMHEHGTKPFVSGTNFLIIKYLMEHPDEQVHQKDIEEKFSITKSTCSRVLKLMEKKALIERIRVETDKRLKRIVPTETSEKIYQGFKNKIAALEKQIRQGFTEEELERLGSDLERIKENLS